MILDDECELNSFSVKTHLVLLLEEDLSLSFFSLLFFISKVKDAVTSTDFVRTTLLLRR